MIIFIITINNKSTRSGIIIIIHFIISGTIKGIGSQFFSD